MEEWLEDILEEVAAMPEVLEVCAADESGAYLAGHNNQSPDEFAAILAFVARSALNTADLLGLEDLRYVSAMGKKDRLIVYRVEQTLVGISLSDKAIVSKIEGKVADLIQKAYDLTN